MSLARGFLPEKFQRIHNWSIEVGIDNIHWLEPTKEELQKYNLFGSNGRSGEAGTGERNNGKGKQKKGNQLRFRDLDDEEGIEDVIERLRKQSEEGIELDEEEG